MSWSIVATVISTVTGSAQQGDAQSRASGKGNTQGNNASWVTPKSQPQQSNMGYQNTTSPNGKFDWNKLINSMSGSGGIMGSGSTVPGGADWFKDIGQQYGIMGGANDSVSNSLTSGSGFNWGNATQQSGLNNLNGNNMSFNDTASQPAASSGGGFPWIQLLQMGLKAGMNSASQQPGQSQNQPASMGVTHNFGNQQQQNMIGF